MASFARGRKLELLDRYFNAINNTILCKQNAASGLIPASVDITSHGDYTDAWVRDNVYTIYAAYGLALAYRRVDDDSGRAFGLEHSVVKLMRGLLFAMMRQAHKVEKFKNNQCVENALHAKYKTETGETVVGDHEWGHLQIDATSFFLVALADMTTSGFIIVYTQDEVDFIQNLVFYIERAYRTPDYGIWERGNKINHGQPELNSSSIGMAVAALHAINGVNLFGTRGGPSSVIHVLPDELTRNVTTLHSFLPRESNSKEIDGSVLSVIGFPAFAVDDADLIRRAKEEAREKLEGKYGWKRFLRDGHQTVLENTKKLHYDSHELKIFQDIECEWPLFFTYLVLDGLFTDNMEQAKTYLDKLQPLIIDSNDLSSLDSPRPAQLGEGSIPTFTTESGSILQQHGIPLLPELYYVPREAIEAEKASPHSQLRIANGNTPLVWALSLYFLGGLIYDNLLSPSEVDPLGRRLRASRPRHDEPLVHICLLSESAALQTTLATYCLETQTLDQIPSNISVLPPQTLTELYAGLGCNEKLSLSGRPKRPVGVLGTSRLYRIQGQIYAFTPHFMDNDEFYINSDPNYLVSAFESELKFTSKNWLYPGRPTIVVLLSNALLGNIRSSHAKHNLGTTADMSKKNLLNFFMNLRNGHSNGVRVRLARLSETINESNIESLDFLVHKPQADWENVLRDARSSLRSASIHKKLAYNESKTQASTPGVRTPGSKTPRRKSTAFQGRTLSTPLDRRPDEQYFDAVASALSKLQSNDEPVFKLKAHEESPPRKTAAHVDTSHPSSIGGVTPQPDAATPHFDTNLTQSPPPETLSLTLNDPSQLPQAVESLVGSVNLYDQIDLLQYLMSCTPESIDYYIGPLGATVKELLEEVYLKSTRLHYWSIARQAAGLLCKVVPSLTISITDLVIRQKQASIGESSVEYLITMPDAPDTLKRMIEKHCNDDVRERSVVQEILIYLGDFIRTRPRMFDGILRLRTHYLIIALREEISRMNQCDEEEAVECLMNLSPFELKSLLGAVLSGPRLCDTTSVSSSTPEHGPGYDAFFQQQTYISIPACSEKGRELVIRAQSAGYLAGNFAKVEVNDYSLHANSRGIHVWAVSGQEQIIVVRDAFDTHISEEESDEFCKFIQGLPSGVVLVVACKDDFVEHLTPAARQALEALGSRTIQNVKYRDSFVFICEKGDPSSGVLEVHCDANDGATPLVEKRMELSSKDMATEIKITMDTIKSLFPNSNERWLRRRRNDGALNRVPPSLFSRTWKILDTSKGLKIYQGILTREQTVLETTPAEFNFALRIESFLGHFIDPVERQIAVDVLMVISTIQKELGEAAQKIDTIIDIPLIMQEAIRIFWDKWTSRNRHRFDGSELFESGQDYTSHKALALKLFGDLPQEGTESTFEYITSGVEHILRLSLPNHTLEATS